MPKKVITLPKDTVAVEKLVQTLAEWAGMSRDMFFAKTLEEHARLARLNPVFGVPSVVKRTPLPLSPSEGPWDLHIDFYDGDRIFQLQARDGEVVCDFRDSHYDAPGKAEANALLMFKLTSEHFGDVGSIDGDAAHTVSSIRRSHLLAGNSISKTRR